MAHGMVHFMIWCMIRCMVWCVVWSMVRCDDAHCIVCCMSTVKSTTVIRVEQFKLEACQIGRIRGEEASS